MDLMAKAVLLSIALGLCLQLIVLVVKLFAGSDFPGVRLVLDIAGSVVWSVLVCAGVAFGTLIMRAGVALSGIIGIFLAPVALFAAKIMQESLGFALGIAAGGVTQTVVILGVIKGLEYGILGAALAVLVGRDEQRLSRYVFVGAATGVLFGLFLVAVMQRLAEASGVPLAPAQIAGQVANETLFPLGCALVIYAVQFAGRRLTSA